LAITTSKQGKTSEGKVGRAPSNVLFVSRLKKLQITSSSIVIIPKKFGDWQLGYKLISSTLKTSRASSKVGIPFTLFKLKNKAMPRCFGVPSQGSSCGDFGWKGIT
jgi:hypothetical protein